MHNLNGRQWWTTCGKYSQTTRCRTDIWASQVSLVNGRYVVSNGWVFNNLTYLPYMTLAQWGENNLANSGHFNSGGHQWRTECDTAATDAAHAAATSGCRT